MNSVDVYTSDMRSSDSMTHSTSQPMNEDFDSGGDMQSNAKIDSFPHQADRAINRATTRAILCMHFYTCNTD